MLCFLSFIFIFVVVAQLDADVITVGQAMFYGAYGLLMFYHTSKPYWTENQEKKQKNRRR